MIVVQLILLKVALDNRSPTGARDGLEHTPFHGYTAEDGLKDLLSGRRPYDFWQWNNSKSYVKGFGPLVSMCVLMSGLQILPVSGLFRFGTARRPCLAPVCVPIAGVHLLPWLPGIGHRGDLTGASDNQEPQSAVLQRFSIIGHCQLAGRRRHEDELFLSQQRVCSVAVSPVWDVPGLL